MSETWNISELFTIIGSILGSFGFIYSEMKSFKQEMKEDFADIRFNRKAEIEQSKQELMINVNDVKQTFKNDLNTFRIDLNDHRKTLNEELILIKKDHTTEIVALKMEAKKDMKEMQQEIVNLTEKIAKLEGMLTAYIPKKQ